MSNLTNGELRFWSLRRADPARIGQPYLMKRSNITTAKVEHGVDTAGWSIITQKNSPPAMPFNTG